MKKMNTFMEPEIEIIFIASEDICSVSPFVKGAETGNAEIKNWGAMWGD